MTTTPKLEQGDAPAMQRHGGGTREDYVRGYELGTAHRYNGGKYALSKDAFSRGYNDGLDGEDRRQREG